MDYETKTFDFTPTKVAGAAKFAKEHTGQWVWKDSAPGSRLFLVAGKRTAAFYTRTKKDGIGKRIRLGEAEGPAALTLTEARERAGQVRFGAEMPAVRRSKGTRAGITTGAVWDRYIAEAKAGTFSLRRRGNRPLSKKTIRGYESNYNAHVRASYHDRDLGHLVLDAVELVRKVAGPDKDGVPHPALGNQVMAVLVAVIEYARRRGLYTGANPFRGLEFSVRSHVDSHEIDLTEAQAAKVYAALETLEEYWRDLFLFLALTGRRVGNATNLAWDQVDLDAGRIVYKSSSMKARRPSVVPITPGLRAILARRKKTVADDTVFVWPAFSDPKKAIRNVHHQWKKVRDRAGVSALTPKGLRHVAVTWALRADVSQAVVGKMADHADARTTAHYAHLTGEDSRPALIVLEKAWAKAAKRSRGLKKGKGSNHAKK